MGEFCLLVELQRWRVCYQQGLLIGRGGGGGGEKGGGGGVLQKLSPAGMQSSISAAQPTYSLALHNNSEKLHNRMHCTEFPAQFYCTIPHWPLGKFVCDFRKICTIKFFLTKEFKITQLAMRSLRPEDFSTSEVVLHTCGPTQIVAKYVPYRWSIKYSFVLRGANKMNHAILNLNVKDFCYLIFYLSS